MKKSLLTLMCCAMAAGGMAETPRWLRNAAISPDGTTIAFTYKGDIFTVPVAGGNANRITAGNSYNTSPVWSPDSKTLVFSSSREGSMDLYAVSASGGTPKRITTNSADETPVAFLDQETVIYQSAVNPSRESSRMPTRLNRTYAVNITKPSPRPRMFLSLPMMSASVGKDGRILYQDKKGLEDVMRKHERSSGTCDVWLYDNGKYQKLTDFNGHDMSPVWNPKGNGYYYLSEQDGTLNVWSSDTDGKNRRQLTGFKQNPVRTLSIADNGTMAFSQDGDLYTLRDGGEPQKLEVNITADMYDSDRVKKYVTSGASNMAVSPDGKELAIVIRGDIYVTDAKYKTTRRITNTPAQERCVSFSPDGRSLVYDSDRDGIWQLFTAEIKNPAEKHFAYATEIEEKPLYKSDKPAQQPAYSPDGKKVAFLEDRVELKVIDVKTKKVNTALDGKYNYSYSDGDVPFEWSPDSNWLLISYIGEGGWNNTDVAIVKADGSETVDLTESGYSDYAAKWALDGKAVTYGTGMYGMKSHGSWGNQDDIILMALEQEAWDNFNVSEEEFNLKAESEKEKDSDKDKTDKDKAGKGKSKSGKKQSKADSKPVVFDLDGRRHRMKRLTDTSVSLSDYYLTPKGDKLYYIAGAAEGGNNLIERNLLKGDNKVVIKDVRGSILSDKKGDNLFVFSGRGIKKLDVDKGTAEPVKFEAAYDRHPSLEREYIYDHAVRQVKDKFYDVNLHGVDWEYYGKHYREFLPYISNSQDFAILLSELLGELNASHTGGRYYADGAEMDTAELGAFFDETYDGDGLKIAEVVSGSPLASRKASVKPGDIITAIDGDKIIADTDYYPLLEGKAGRKTLLNILRTSGKTDTLTIKPLSRSAMNELLYNRWVENNERFVDSISNGQIGYVHVRGMDSPSFRTVYDRLLGKYRNCDAVVVDTRWNGGGWLHNDLAVLLGGREYVRFMPRGRYIGSEPFSQWYKPSAMLVNEGNYSDAHGSPYTYKTLGLGKLVGAPVPGTMTAVWWETQIDPDIVFGIPQVTNADLNGRPLENVQLNPDIEVYNDPADELKGHDMQLEKAVRSLMK